MQNQYDVETGANNICVKSKDPTPEASSYWAMNNLGKIMSTQQSHLTQLFNRNVRIIYIQVPKNQHNTSHLINDQPDISVPSINPTLS